MCQCQLSLLTLTSEAAMPPCAATVCERVGNTLDSTATFSPACVSCNAARIPAPPAPTAPGRGGSKQSSPERRDGREGLEPPQDLYRPDRIKQQNQNHQHMNDQTHPCRFDVIHHNIRSEEH